MMRRRRWINPEFFTSEDVLALPRDARLTFIGLWLYADDYGRERTNAALIKADVWPVEEDITPADVEEHLLLCAVQDMVQLYKVDGREYFQLTNWDRWQPVQNPSRSRIPAPSALPPALDPIEPPADSTEDRRSEGEREEREGERETRERAGEGPGERGAATHPPETAAQTEASPSPFCTQHPDGTDKPCRACGTARMRFSLWKTQHGESEDQA